MILTVNEFRQYHQTDETDAVLALKLNAMETMIRAYTNNSFHARGFKQEMIITNGVFSTSSLLPFKAGDTVQMMNSAFCDGLYTVKTVNGNSFTVNEDTMSDDAGIVSKVVYPADVVIGVVNLMKWELERRDKVGIQSETLSRHTVNYVDPNTHQIYAGYPKYLISFLNTYKRARFGDGAAR